MYSFVIYIYVIGVRIASLFSKKVRLMVNGHRQTFRILREQIKKDEKYIWFHAASLGEFEQGRPMMERVRKEHPEFKILLTFFSPSGYEVRKNYDGADVICYLPLDTPTNVHRFFKCVAFLRNGNIRIFLIKRFSCGKHAVKIFVFTKDYAPLLYIIQPLYKFFF